MKVDETVTPFPRPVRLKIGSTDIATAEYEVEAHYNPKEIDLAHQSTWVDEGSLKGMVAGDERVDDTHDIQYTGAPARTMTLELFLDDYEPEPKNKKNIHQIVDLLHRLASPRDEHSNDPQMRRPHRCVVAWGHQRFPPFRCVIESIAVKYTMFSLQGFPVRAVCTLKLKEMRASKRLRGAS